MNLQDRMFGMLIGGFVGDALGAPYEFKISKPLSTYRGLLEYEVKVPRLYHEPVVYPIGSITDDPSEASPHGGAWAHSQMTLALISSLVTKKTYDKNDVIMRYISFANTTTQLGKNTRALFKGIKTLRGYESRRTKLEPTMESNGSLMRAAPLVVFRDYQIWLTDTNITNISQTNSICTIIYVSSLRAALLNQTKEYIMSLAVGLASQYQNSHVIEAINQAKEGVKRNVDVKIEGSKRSNKGWVVHALYAAFWALHNFNDYKSAIDHVILCATRPREASLHLGRMRYGYKC